jgi:transposase
LLVDASGIPLAVRLTGGNRNDVTQLIPLVEDLHRRPVTGKGRPATPEA